MNNRINLNKFERKNQVLVIMGGIELDYTSMCMAQPHVGRALE